MDQGCLDESGVCVESCVELDVGRLAMVARLLVLGDRSWMMDSCESC